MDKNNKIHLLLLFKYSLLFIILNINGSEADWNLVFNDEFNGKIFDTNKWKAENESTSCHGNYVNQLSCNTNRSENLRLIDGTLAMTAMYEKYLDKEYTSARITTKQGFTNGKFEIRAALPKGKMLRPTMFMIPKTRSPHWAEGGQIDIMTNAQDSSLGSGLHYNIPHIYEFNGIYYANTRLDKFNVYSLEWNEFEFKWFFNDYNYQTINISRILGSTYHTIYTKNGQPFDKPFRLRINLGIGGSVGDKVFFPNMILTKDDLMQWKCSLLIIDYVRIYEWVNQTIKSNLTVDEISVDNICETTMPLITPVVSNNSTISTPIIYVSGFILLLIIILMIILIVSLKQRNNKRQNIEINIENYDDVCNAEGYDVYDEANTSNVYTSEYDQIEAIGKCDDTSKKSKRISVPGYVTMNRVN